MKQGKTIVAIATPHQMGGISIIRISGEEAISIADRIFKAASGVLLSDKKGYTAVFGEVHSNDIQLDTSIATVFKAPKSYTGEDVVEISCHGGILITRQVLRAVCDAGAELAEAGEFTKRAFLNGKVSLTQAEAIIDMISAENEQALNVAKGQKDGALFKRIERIKDKLVQIAGHLAAWIDYPEEDISEVDNQTLAVDLAKVYEDMATLVSSYDIGRVVREGIETAIIGKPNVGKSTLMNLLAGTRRSIVTDVAGTTRDVIEDTVNLGDITLKLWDTAGIRKSDDMIEQMGVELARERLERASLVLAVFDGSTSLEKDEIEWAEQLRGRPCIAVINKNDLEQRVTKEELSKYFETVIALSAKDEAALETLCSEIKRKTSQYSLDPSAGVIANERQLICAKNALVAIDEAREAAEIGVTLDAVTVLIDEAVENLMQLTGQSVTQEIVNEVFSHFCVGK